MSDNAAVMNAAGWGLIALCVWTVVSLVVADLIAWVCGRRERNTPTPPAEYEQAAPRWRVNDRPDQEPYDLEAVETVDELIQWLRSDTEKRGAA